MVPSTPLLEGDLLMSTSTTNDDSNVPHSDCVLSSPVARRRVIFPFLHISPYTPEKPRRDYSNIETSPASVTALIDKASETPRQAPKNQQQQRALDDLALLTLTQLTLSDATEGMGLVQAMTSCGIMRYLVVRDHADLEGFPILLPHTMTRRSSAPASSSLLRSYNAWPVSQQPLKSILRSKTYPNIENHSKQLFGFEHSSLPSLLSLEDEENDSQSSTDSPDSSQSLIVSRLAASPNSRVITFDPRIWVREFHRSDDEKLSTWYSMSELERFKRHSLTRIFEYHGNSIVATATGRSIPRRVPMTKALYTNPALTLESETPADEEKNNQATNLSPFERAVLECEIRNILLVDPHDICLKLMDKSFKRIMPHVAITTARSSEEAIRRVEALTANDGFDIVVIEERLQLFCRRSSVTGSSSDNSNNSNTTCPMSGSSLLHMLKAKGVGNTDCLFIGMSAHLDQDRAKLAHGGADIIWSKPPPTMNSTVRQTLLQAILLKRGRRALAATLFGLLPATATTTIT